MRCDSLQRQDIHLAVCFSIPDRPYIIQKNNSFLSTCIKLFQSRILHSLCGSMDTWAWHGIHCISLFWNIFHFTLLIIRSPLPLFCSTHVEEGFSTTDSESASPAVGAASSSMSGPFSCAIAATCSLN